MSCDGSIIKLEDGDEILSLSGDNCGDESIVVETLGEVTIGVAIVVLIIDVIWY